MERKVHVFSPDQKEDWGVGTYLGDTTLRTEFQLGFLEEPLEGLTELLADEVTPKIRLESGKIVYGMGCWWHDLEHVQN